MQQFVIKYNSTKEELLIYYIEQGIASAPEPSLTVPLKLTDFVTLESGAAYLGFC